MKNYMCYCRIHDQDFIYWDVAGENERVWLLNFMDDNKQFQHQIMNIMANNSKDLRDPDYTSGGALYGWFLRPDAKILSSIEW